MKHSLAVVALALSLVGCGSATPEDAQQLAGPGEAGDVAAPCPAGPDDGLAAGPTPVRRGAVAARLCVYPLGPDDGSAPPLRPVVVHGEEAEALSADLATARKSSGDEICTADLGPTGQVLLQYDDGRSTAVAMEMYGCGYARTAPEERLVLADEGRVRQRLSQAREQALRQPSPSAAPSTSGDPDTPVSSSPE